MVNIKIKQSVLYLNHKVQIIYCDTTFSNTGSLSRACSLFGAFSFELVLKTVVKTKTKQIINSPNILIFKQIRNNWKNINANDIQLCIDFVKEHVAETNITSFSMFYKADLDKAYNKRLSRIDPRMCSVFGKICR